ncbi:MAG: 2'-5' RNA ligase family protein, partial [Proteobacteria bacterium]
TAELPPDILAWADRLRREHYPPDRNRLRAHVTLFHALPPSSEGELRRVLADLAKSAPPPARICGIMDLGTGTAFDVDSPAMADVHDFLAERLHGLLGWQDDRRLRLHITVQNKVKRPLAKALQRELGESLECRSFRFHGLGLYAWEDGLWRPISEYAFRG